MKRRIAKLLNLVAYNISGRVFNTVNAAFK